MYNAHSGVGFVRDRDLHSQGDQVDASGHVCIYAHLFRSFDHRERIVYPPLQT
jgi:hypothetical protein